MRRMTELASSLNSIVRNERKGIKEMEDDRRKGLYETLGKAEEVDVIRMIVNRHYWRFAKTYAAFCPHEYTLREGWKQDSEFRMLVKHIWKYGLEAYYGKKTKPNRYWFDHETGYYYFIFPGDTDEEGNATEEIILVNRAKISEFDFWLDEGKGIIRCAWNKKMKQ